MPTCQNCFHDWTWKQTMKSLFRLKCPQCGAKQYEATSSRRKGSMFSVFPLVAIPINSSLGFTWIVAFVSLLVMITIIMLIYPFILKLSNEQEPLW